MHATRGGGVYALAAVLKAMRVHRDSADVQVQNQSRRRCVGVSPVPVEMWQG